uniref:Hemocyanin C-terminal domain-containing protein n=1 Tax=Trichuris muris TaxID=70415 RepID=A0A5S6QGD4_TRIMR
MEWKKTVKIRTRHSILSLTAESGYHESSEGLRPFRISTVQDFVNSGFVNPAFRQVGISSIRDYDFGIPFFRDFDVRDFDRHRFIQEFTVTN